MEITIGKDKYELSEHDLVLFDGSKYQITTQETEDRDYPVIAKTKAEKMVKDEHLIEVRRFPNPHAPGDLVFYRIQEKTEEQQKEK